MILANWPNDKHIICNINNDISLRIPSHPINQKQTTYEQTLPINLNILGYNKTLLNAPTNLKDFINSYTKQKEIFDLQERHETTI